MQIIESIICFNSGSAGDLLKALCLIQKIDATVKNESTGAITLESYFKDWSKDVFYNLSVRSTLDASKVSYIENTHYWLDFYPEISKKLFYIDYPDTLQTVILETVKKKRYDDDWAVLIEKNIAHLPPQLANKINLKNVQQVFNLRWLRNLKSWRNNKLLKRIDFLDFLNESKLIDTILEVSGCTEFDHQKFQKIYNTWIDTNQDLLQKIV